MATIRKSAFALTAAERNRYLTVVANLNSGPTPTRYGKLVAHHRDMSHLMHGSMGLIGAQRFLSWHRDYLLKLEQQMQSLDPASFIPYWSWSKNRAIPSWMAGVLPTVAVPAAGGMPAATVNVTRTPHLPAGLPTAAQINSLDANPGLSYTQFTSLLES